MSLGKLEQIQIGVEKVSSGVSGAVITFIMLLTTVDVFLRYVFNSPLPGAYILCEIR
jgi:TRAP-type C4-dicarboxylate transport system permease small subunit